MDTKAIAKISIDRFAEQLRKSEAVLFWQYLDENPTTRQILTGLYEAGCDPLTLMTLAVLYCKGEEIALTEITKRATGYSEHQLAALSERLLQAARDIQALNESAMPGGVTLGKLIRVFGGGELLEKTLAPVLPSEELDFELTRLPVILSAYSVFLTSWPHPAYRALMADKDFGRKFFLAELVVYIERVLGHANWKAIVAVISSVHFVLSEPKGVSVDAENLRQEFEAYRNRNPKISSDIQRWAEMATGSRRTQTA